MTKFWLYGLNLDNKPTILGLTPDEAEKVISLLQAFVESSKHEPLEDES